MKSCDLKWLTDSLAVKNAHPAKESCMGSGRASDSQSGQVFRKPYSICYTRASKQANLACNIQEGP